jgi:hypothetical protein
MRTALDVEKPTEDGCQLLSVGRSLLDQLGSGPVVVAAVRGTTLLVRASGASRP